jgi:hypothetical protein
MSPGIDGSEITTALLQELGYSYTLDWPLYDQPVWLRTQSGGGILSVPYSTEMNDITFIATRHGLAREFSDVIIDSFDEMLAQSAAQPLVFGISAHTFLSGQPGRIRQLRRALRYIHDHSDAYGGRRVVRLQTISSRSTCSAARESDVRTSGSEAAA